jgi:urease accessory protein
VDSEALLVALQLGDSLFPSGAFAQSNGLETLVADGEVRTAADLSALLRTHLRHRLARADLPAMLAAHAAAAAGDLDTVLEADRLLAAVRMAREERTASARVGARIAAEAARLEPCPVLAAYAAAVACAETPGSAAVALALAARAMGLDAAGAALVACHSTATGLVSAAMRLGRIGHGEAQAILRDCRADIATAVETARRRDWRDPRPGAPQLDIAGARHERATARLFAS